MRLNKFLNISFLASLVISGSVVVSSALADDWACEVALCLSNPAGAMAVSQCVPPITKLHKHLAKGGSFPLCQSADGHVKFTRYGQDHYENCPANTKTIYRIDTDQGSRSGKFCETFTPIHGFNGSISSDHYRHNQDNNRPYYDVRTINGKRVYGKVEFQKPPRRAKPNYLEYVVRGNTNRIWW